VRFYLKRYPFTQVRQCIHRALLAVANQVLTFAVAVAVTRKSRSLVEVQHPPTLARQSQALQAHTLDLALVYTNQQKMQRQSRQLTQGRKGAGRGSSFDVEAAPRKFCVEGVHGDAPAAGLDPLFIGDPPAAGPLPSALELVVVLAHDLIVVGPLDDCQLVAGLDQLPATPDTDFPYCFNAPAMPSINGRWRKKNSSIVGDSDMTAAAHNNVHCVVFCPTNA